MAAEADSGADPRPPAPSPCWPLPGSHVRIQLETYSSFVAAGSVNRASVLEEYKSPNTVGHSPNRALRRGPGRDY